MKKRWKRTAAVLLALAMAFTSVAVWDSQAEAATSYMNKLGVTFGIKQNKAYRFTQKLTGIGDRNISWTMKNVKVKKAKKSGYKQLTCVLEFNSDFTLTPLEVDAVTSTDYSIKNNNSGANMWYAVVDGKTGLDVETKDNDVKVKVKSKRLAYRYNTFYGSDLETWQNAVFLWKTRLTITYPSDYKDLCIGFGGGNVLSGDMTKADANFWKGTTPFGKTTAYTKGKKNSRWVRVSSLK